MSLIDPNFYKPIDDGSELKEHRPLYIATIDSDERMAWRTYAAAALQGMLSSDYIAGDQFATVAGEYADAMLAVEKERFK